MNPGVLIVLFFLVALGICMSGLYFFVAQPLARRKLKLRLTTPQAVLDDEEDGGGSQDIVRAKAIINIPALSALAPKLEFFLQQAAIKTPVSKFVSIAAGLAVVAALVALGFGLAFVFVVLAAIAGGLLPFWFASFKRKKRFSTFQEQFPDAIDMLARAVRAGHAFNVAFSLIADEMADPVAEEFRFTHRQQNLGMPLRDALRNLATRLPLPDVRIFITALQIQRESGGNLGEILDNLSTVIRERFRLLREVEVLTTEARVTMYVLIGMPYAALGMMYVLNPEYIKPLFTEALGHTMLYAAGFMQVVAVVVIRQIVKIKV
jgi:tight adherence protein B